MWWLQKVARRVTRGPAVVGDAIREQLVKVTGATDPFVFDYPQLDDLQVLAFYSAEPQPHLLYCTFGLAPVRTSAPLAGTHTELTLRVPVSDGLPPQWPADVLAGMVRHVRRRQTEILPGHYLDWHRPVTEGARITAFSFVTDPLLGIVDAPTGLFRFTYAVGLTAQDLEDALCWNPLKFTGVLGDFFPLGITHVQREDLRGLPQARAILERTRAEQGSSIRAVEAKVLDVEASGRVDMDVAAARALWRAVLHRLPLGHDFGLVGKHAWLRIGAGLAPLLADAHLELPATDQLLAEFKAIFDPSPGVYRFTTHPLEIHVVDVGR